jgi:hypothetical protein
MCRIISTVRCDAHAYECLSLGHWSHTWGEQAPPTRDDGEAARVLATPEVWDVLRLSTLPERLLVFADQLATSTGVLVMAQRCVGAASLEALQPGTAMPGPRVSCLVAGDAGDPGGVQSFMKLNL